MPYASHKNLLPGSNSICTISVLSFRTQFPDVASSASHKRISPANPLNTITSLAPTKGTLCEIPALFFVSNATADVVPVAVFASVPNMAGFESVFIVVVTTATEACFVVASIVVGDIMMVVSTVDIGVGDAVLGIVASIVGADADTATLEGTPVIVGKFVDATEAKTTLSRDTMVDAAMVVAGMVVSGNVVVNVMVTSSPSALAGMALPTPEAVYWLGNARVAVLGFAASFAEYKFPVVPLTKV